MRVFYKILKTDSSVKAPLSRNKKIQKRALVDQVRGREPE
jgi:hypothetical protein